jgi:FixJ family two-component response regulator
VAINPNLVRADLAWTLPAARSERLHSGAYPGNCPSGALAMTVKPRLAEMVIDRPEVAILECDQVLARSMARILQAEGIVARTWASAAEFMAQPEPALSGCVIANAIMPDMSGLELQREIGARRWPLPVIFLTSAGDITTAVRSMKAGAINCLPKPVERAQLLEAVREALSESRSVCAQRAAQLRVRHMLEALTPREREVLDLAVTGLLVKQIAARLGTAEKTVKTHKGRLMRKMQVRSTLALVQLMITAGLSPVPAAPRAGG